MTLTPSHKRRRKTSSPSPSPPTSSGSSPMSSQWQQFLSALARMTPNEIEEMEDSEVAVFATTATRFDVTGKKWTIDEVRRQAAASAVVKVPSPAAQPINDCQALPVRESLMAAYKAGTTLVKTLACNMENTVPADRSSAEGAGATKKTDRSDRLVYCITRPTSDDSQLYPPELQLAIVQLIAVEVQGALRDLEVEYSDLRIAVRTGCAAVPTFPRRRRRLRSTDPRWIAEPADWLADVVGCVTDVVVIDGATGMSVNLALLKAVVGALATRGGRIIILNPRAAPVVHNARMLLPALDNMNDYLSNRLFWQGSDSLQRGEDPEHLLDTMSLQLARADLQGLRSFGAPECELARRWVGAFLWRRIASLNLRLAMAIGYDDEGATDARRWNSERGHLSALVKRHWPDRAASKSYVDSDNEEDDDDNVVPDGSAKSSSYTRLRVPPSYPIAPLFLHRQGWCDHCHGFNRTYIGDGYEQCASCRRRPERLQWLDRGGITGLEPADARLTAPGVHERRAGGCSNTACPLANRTDVKMIVCSDEQLRCQQCRNYFNRWGEDNPRPTPKGGQRSFS